MIFSYCRAPSIQQAENPPPQRNRNSVSAIVCRQFGNDVPHVGLDRVLANAQTVRDHLVGIPGCDFLQNLELLAELRKAENVEVSLKQEDRKMIRREGETAVSWCRQTT